MGGVEPEMGGEEVVGVEIGEEGCVYWGEEGGGEEGDC